MSDKRRRWWWWLAIAAAIVVAILLLRCAGIGFGGADDDREDAETPTAQPLAEVPSAPNPRCRVRVDSTGVSLAGTRIETADMIARCKAGVELTVTGDARFGDAEAVREAVRAAGIDLLDRSK